MELNLEKPIREGIWIGQKGKDFFRVISYENLPLFCANCSCIGHKMQDCLKESIGKNHDPETAKDPRVSATVKEWLASELEEMTQTPWIRVASRRRMKGKQQPPARSSGMNTLRNRRTSIGVYEHRYSDHDRGEEDPLTYSKNMNGENPELHLPVHTRNETENPEPRGTQATAISMAVNGGFRRQGRQSDKAISKPRRSNLNDSDINCDTGVEKKLLRKKKII